MGERSPTDAGRRGWMVGLWTALAVGCGGVSAPPPQEEVDAGVTECSGTDDDPLNCGACGRVCRLSNATAGCAAAECTVVTCRPGFVDLDGDPANGCESAGSCVPDEACPSSCGTTGVRSCDEESLGVCLPPAETCNAIDDNCDSACDEGALAGCRVGIHRSYGGTGHLYTSDLTAASTAPYMLEVENFFYLYSPPVAGTVPVFLCKKTDGGNFFITASSTCESLGTVQKTLGRWSMSSSCGAVPLYRMFSATAKNHFFALDEGEVDVAVGLGYVFQGIAGYVWTEP